MFSGEEVAKGAKGGTACGGFPIITFSNFLFQNFFSISYLFFLKRFSINYLKIMEQEVSCSIVPKLRSGFGKNARISIN